MHKLHEFKSTDLITIFRQVPFKEEIENSQIEIRSVEEKSYSKKE